MVENPSKESSQQTAKRRFSPVKIALIILALLLVLFVVKIILLITATPKITVDYVAEYNEISKPANYDPNQNAAPYYEKAFNTFWEIPYAAKRYQHIWPDEMDDTQLETINKWLALNSQALSYLEKAFSKPYYWVQQRPDGLGTRGMLDIVRKPHYLSNFLQAAYFLDLKTRVIINQGETEHALEPITKLHKMGTHLCGPKILIEQLIGIRFKNMAVNNVFSILDRLSIDVITLNQWQQKLEHEIFQNRKEVCVESEKFLAYDTIQRIFTDNGRGNGSLIPRKAYELIEPAIIMAISPTETEMEEFFRYRYLKLIWLSIAGPNRRKTTRIVDKFFAYVETLKGQTPWQLHSEDIDSDEQICGMLKGYIIEEHISAIYPIIERYQRLKAKETALITTIIILQYKAEKGQLPENLDQLIEAGYLGELPMDPYSDGPLVYKCIGNNFTLYSSGADFDDDGGVPSNWDEGEQGGDYVFWPAERPK